MDFEKFINAQNEDYFDALEELRSEFKEGHWMWYVFPQLAGLGHSQTAKKYAIKSLDEAQQYISHPILGARLIEASTLLTRLKSSDALAVFGYPDNLKLRSCMTLFSLVSDNPVFEQVLAKFYNGEKDNLTLEKLGLL